MTSRAAGVPPFPPGYRASASDVWANPELFVLGKDHRPTVVAGVPPDYFSADGQLWGNLVYDWRRFAGANIAGASSAFARCWPR